MTRFLPLLCTIGVIGSACSDFGGGPELDTNFELPRTEAFPERLSSYGLYQGNMAERVPAQGVHLYDISSALFTDYARKQRLIKRARAYLDVNCSHCHSPDAWGRSAREGFDFRYEVALGESGIAEDSAEIAEALADGEMPFVGTTVPDDEGIALVLEYLDSL